MKTPKLTPHPLPSKAHHCPAFIRPLRTCPDPGWGAGPHGPQTPSLVAYCTYSGSSCNSGKGSSTRSRCPQWMQTQALFVLLTPSRSGPFTLLQTHVPKAQLTQWAPKKEALTAERKSRPLGRRRSLYHQSVSPLAASASTWNVARLRPRRKEQEALSLSADLFLLC